MSEATSSQTQTGATDESPRRSHISFDDAYQILSRDDKQTPDKISFQRDSGYFCHVEFATDPLPVIYEAIDVEKMNAVNTDDLQLERDGDYRTCVDGKRSKNRFTTGKIARTSRFHYDNKDIEVRDKKGTAFNRFKAWFKKIMDPLSKGFTKKAVFAMPLHVTLVMTAPIGTLGEAERWASTIKVWTDEWLQHMPRVYLAIKIDLPCHPFAQQGRFNNYCQRLRELKTKFPNRVDLDMVSIGILQENNLDDYYLRSENFHHYMERLEQGPDAPGFEEAAKAKNQRENIDFLQKFVRENIPLGANHGEEHAEKRFKANRTEMPQKFYKGLNNASQVQGVILSSRDQNRTLESISIPGGRNWLLQESLPEMPPATFQQDTGLQQALQTPQLPQPEVSAAEHEIGPGDIPIYRPDDLSFPTGPIDWNDSVSVGQPDLSDYPSIDQLLNNPVGEETFQIPEEHQVFEKDFFGSPSSPPNGELPQANPPEVPRSDDPPVPVQGNNRNWAEEQYLESHEVRFAEPWANEYLIDVVQTTGTPPNYGGFQQPPRSL